LYVSPISQQLTAGIKAVFAAGGAAGGSRGYMYMDRVRIQIMTAEAPATTVSDETYDLTVSGPQQSTPKGFDFALDPGNYVVNVWGYNTTVSAQPTTESHDNPFTVRDGQWTTLRLSLIPIASNLPNTDPFSDSVLSATFNSAFNPAIQDPAVYNPVVLTLGGEKWYQLVPSSNVLRVNVDPGAASVYAALFSADGRYKAGKASDNLMGAATQGTVEFETGVTAGQTVFLGIVAFNKEGVSPYNVGYDVSFPSTLFVDDSWEDNDSIGTAAALTGQLPIEVTPRAYDQDFFSFTLPQSGNYSLTVASPDASLLRIAIARRSLDGNPWGDKQQDNVSSLTFEFSGTMGDTFIFELVLSKRDPVYQYEVPVGDYNLTIAQTGVVNPPATPTNATLNSGYDEYGPYIGIHWDYVDDATGYTVYRYYDDTFTSPAYFNIDAGSDYFRDRSVDSYHTYYYAVAAVNVAGESAKTTATAVATPYWEALTSEAHSSWLGGYYDGRMIAIGQEVIAQRDMTVQAFAFDIGTFATYDNQALPATVDLRLVAMDSAGATIGIFDRSIDPIAWTGGYLFWDNLGLSLTYGSKYRFAVYVNGATDYPYIHTSIGANAFDPYANVGRISAVDFAGTDFTAAANYSVDNSGWDMHYVLVGAGPDVPIPNQAPQAVLFRSIQNVTKGDAVTLYGDQSYDSDNSGTLSYSWSIDQNPAGSTAYIQNPTSANAAFAPDAAGTYVIRLEVSDGQDTGFNTMAFDVADNTAPTATATALSNAIPLSSGGVYVSAQDATDPDGDDFVYQWEVASVPAGSSSSYFDSYSAAGTDFHPDVLGQYLIRLRVTDAHNASTSSDFMLMVAQMPVVATPSMTTVGYLAYFSAPGCYDPNGGGLSYEWSVWSPPDNGYSVAFSNTAAAAPTMVLPTMSFNNCTIRLTVTNSYGWSDYVDYGFAWDAGTAWSGTIGAE
jgi:hypothetical protein